MATSLPAMQQVSLFKLDLTSPKIKKLKEKSQLEEIISSIVNLYNAQVEERNRFEAVPIDNEKWKSLNTKSFSLRWFVSVRRVKMSGVASTLVTLSGKNGLQLGTVTEHHLMFLYKKYKLKETSEVVSCIFALTTDKANYVIRDFVDFSFSSDMARRICKPIFRSKNKMNLSGAALATNDMYKEKLSFRYSALESLSELIKGYLTELKAATSLYQLDAFKTFVKIGKDEKKEHEPLKVMVGEMFLKFHHGFTLVQQAQLCHQLLVIQHAKKDGDVDGVDPAFEYLDHIKKVPDIDADLISQLKSLLIEKIYEVYKGEKSHVLEFYHHHYQDYFDSFRFFLRRKKTKTSLATWAVPPTAVEVITVLKKHVKCTSFASFCLGIKELVFDFYKGSQKKTFALATFFKGEVLHEGKPYFYLDGKWCRVEAEYYSFVQNEFLLQMREVFLSQKAPGYLPLAWVNNEMWFHFPMSALGTTYKGKTPWEIQTKALLEAKFCYVNAEDVVQDFSMHPYGSNDSFKEHSMVLSQFLKEWKGKKISLDLLKQSVIKKNEGAPNLFETLKQACSFISYDKTKSRYFIRQNPDKLPKNLKGSLGEEVLKELTTYWKRFENYREKEEAYNRNYLFNHFDAQGKPFGVEKGYLVFDQVYASEEQKVELFDVAHYTPTETFLYHIKEGFGQKTRDACSQIRTAAATLDSALKIGGNSDILSVIFDATVENATTSPFRKKVQEQLLSFGKNTKEAKKQFLALFKQRKLTFVYAFLDSAEQERVLEKELQREYRFTAPRFGGEECTTYRGQETLTSAFIFTSLKTEGYLDAEGRLTDKFIKINKAGAFHPKFLGERKKNREAIYTLLGSGLSQFPSFIAKKELLDTKKYIDSLGFGFRVCQIYRDGEPSATSFQIPSALGTHTDKKPAFRFENIFAFNDRIYKKELTVGDGACALHALMGEEGKQGLEFCAQEKDSQKAAKQDFLRRLDANKDKMPTLMDKTYLFFERLLSEAYWKHPPYEAKVIFSQFPIHDWKQEKDEMAAELKDKKEERNAAFWDHIMALPINDKKLEKYCEILRSYDRENWKEIDQKNLLEEIEERDKHAVLNGCWNELYKVIDAKVANECGFADREKEMKKLNEGVKNFANEKIKLHISEIFEAYKTQLLSSSFYMSEQELEIAAMLYNKKGVVFGSNEEGECLTEHPHLLNCATLKEVEIVILNEQFPAHYSRCSVLE